MSKGGSFMATSLLRNFFPISFMYREEAKQKNDNKSLDGQVRICLSLSPLKWKEASKEGRRGAIAFYGLRRLNSLFSSSYMYVCVCILKRVE